MGVEGVINSTQNHDPSNVIGQEESADWMRSFHAKATDLSTSSSDLMEFMLPEISGGELTPAQNVAIQMSLQARQQLISTISNVLRTIGESAMAVIRNVRA